MKSNLKKIYAKKDRYDILNNPGLFMENPFYQVNSFINGIDKNLTKNFKDNLEDLVIVNMPFSGYAVDYNFKANILFCNKKDADIFGLLHVASNDRTKPYTGIITNEGIGYGLNTGVTDLLTNGINYSDFTYLLETTIAKVLFIINNKLMYNSYFNNSAEDLINYNLTIKDLMEYVDKYYDNNEKLYNLYNERFILTFRKYLSNSDKEKLSKINEQIYNLENDNYTNVYFIFNYTLNIINNSSLSLSEKEDLYVRLKNEFDIIFNSEQFSYLSDLTSEFDKNIKVRKK